jgi:hypothetical protein
VATLDPLFKCITLIIVRTRRIHLFDSFVLIVGYGPVHPPKIILIQQSYHGCLSSLPIDNLPRCCLKYVSSIEKQIINMDKLKQLLIQYFKELPEERQQWQPRVMEIPGLEQKELTYLHGMLIAHGWIEQNSGYADQLESVDKVAGCYRITSLGTREVRGIQDSFEDV